MHAERPIQPATPPPAAPLPRDAVQTWGWSLLTLFLALLVGAMIVLITKRLVFSGRVSSKNAKRKRTDTRSAWEEAGRRMQTPDSDLKEEP